MIHAKKNAEKTCAVLVSRNGAACIQTALKSLRAGSHPVDIIVVDNASTDTTQDVVRTHENVMLDVLPENIGFGAANNRGIAKALDRGADCILLLNQDAILEGTTLEELCALLDNNPDYGIISPLHRNRSGDALDKNFAGYLAENPALISDALCGKPDELYEISFVNAAAWLVRRTVFERVGGFDPLYFMYGEDNDYCQRVRFHGFKVGITPQCSALHCRDDLPPVVGRIERSRADQLYVQCITMLKRPDRTFARSLMGMLLLWVRMLLHSAVECDARECAALMRSLFRTVPRLVRIRMHHALCRGYAAPWIAPPPS